MDENNDVNKLNTILGVEEDKSVGSKIKSFTKKLGKVPEVKTIDLKPRADFRKTNKELNKQLDKWRAYGKKHAGNPIANYFFGNKHRVKATKRVFAELEKTAFKSNQKYQASLNALLGDDRDKNKGRGFQYGGEIGDTKKSHDGAIKNKAMYQKELNGLQQEYNKLLEQQKRLNLLPTEKEAAERKASTQTKLNEQYAKRDTAYKKSPDGAAGSAKIRAIMDQGAEWNTEVLKLAAGYYARTNGDESLFERAKAAIEGKTAEDEAEFKKIANKLAKAQHQKAGYTSRLNTLLAKQKANPDEDMSEAIADAKGNKAKAESDVNLFTDEKKIQEKFMRLNEKRKAQYDYYYTNKHKPQDFAKDQKGYDTNEFAPKLDNRLRDITAKYKDLAESMKNMTSSQELANIDADIQAALNAVKQAEVAAKNTRNEAEAEDVKKQLDKTNNKIKEAEKNLQKEIQNAEHLRDVFSDLHSQATKIAKQLKLWKLDLSVDPFKYEMQSDDAKKYNDIVQDIKSGVIGIGNGWKKSNIFTRLISRILINIRSQIADMVNPLTLFRKGWDAWLDRFDNLPWKNTFDVIGYNMVTAFEPVFKWLANALIKVAQLLNPLFKKLAGVDLFDKSAWQLEKIKKGMGQLTASFDELHSNNDNPNQFNTAFDLGQISPLNPKTQEAAEKFADGVKKAWDTTIGFIKEHPLISAILGGAALLLGPKVLGKLALKSIAGIGKILGKGFSKMFPNLTAGIKTLGAKITGLLGKEIHTGAGAWGTKAGVTLGKALLGGTMMLGGTIGSVLIGANAGKNWEDLGAGMKIASVAGSALTAGMAGLGAVMLGATGIAGWSVAGVVALGSLAVGMAQTQDGISSIKDQTEQLTEAQNIAKTANDNYVISMNNLANTMSQLEQLEQQTGLSGAQLAEQVKNGVLQVDNMTTAQLQVYNAYLQNEEMIKQLKIATEQKTEADKQAAIKALELEAANAIASDSYDDLLTSVKTAMEEGSISATEGADIMSRALANASNEVQDEFRNKIPEAMKEGFDPDKYESAFRILANNIGEWFKGLGEKISGWWEGVTQNSDRTFKGFMADVLPGGKTSADFPSYDVGTNYVPNDQLAMVHKGEAIIPAKYNKPYSPTSNNSNLENTVSAMTQEIANLRSLIQAGIPVKGEFKQRGSDLVAVVEKGKNRNGNSTLSNPAYAR